MLVLYLNILVKLSHNLRGIEKGLEIKLLIHLNI